MPNYKNLDLFKGWMDDQIPFSDPEILLICVRYEAFFKTIISQNWMSSVYIIIISFSKEIIFVLHCEYVGFLKVFIVESIQ